MRTRLAALALLVFWPFSVVADEPPAAPAPPASDLHPVAGPKKIPLGHELTLDLPEGYVFFDKNDGNKLLKKMGNQPSDALMGLVAGDGEWFVDLSYEDSGYVKDDDGEKLNGDDILKDMRDGLDDFNEYRKENGFPPMAIDGWTDPPRYDCTTHRVVWGLKVSSSSGVSINFYTRVLGRKGYAALNLVAAPEQLEAAKPHAVELLKATTFDKGAAYADFEVGKDKVADYGLAALVAGGAGVIALKAAKVGILAKLLTKAGVILLAMKKGIIVVLAAIAGLFKKIFGKETPPPAAPPPPSENPPSV